MLGTTDELDDPIRVLYVNSDPAFAELVQTKLQQTSTEIDCIPADGLDEALHNLAADRIDCIVTAYSLDDSDGIGLTESIRQQNDDIPIILFTGQGSEEIASEATRAGVSDYIPVRSERDNFTLLAARIRTLTRAARKRTEAEQTKRRFRRTLERATDAIYAVDSDWRIEYINEKMAERVERDPDAIVGQTIWEEFPSIVGTELEDKYRTAMETGEPVSFEQWLGEPFGYWVEVRAFPDDDGLTVFSREITAERERELELERSDAILENIHDVVFVLGEQGDIEFANTAAKRLLAGDQSAQIIGQQIETVVGDRVSDSDATRFSQAVESTLDEVESDGGSTGLYDTDLQLDVVAGASERTLDVRVTPFQSRKRKQILVVARDVTEQSEVNRQLERERDGLQDLQAVMAESDVSAESRLQNLLEVGCQTLGLEIGIVSRIQESDYTVEAVHAPEADIEAGDQFDLASTYCAEVVGTDSVCSFADAVSDGKETHPAYREFELESYIGVPLVVDDTRYGTVNFSSPTTRVAPFGALERTFVELVTQLVSTEISRRRDRAELERQEFLFDRVQDIADIGIWEFIPSSGELAWSDGVRQIHGVDEDYEPPLDDAIEFYHPDDRETITAAVDRAIEDGEPYDLNLRIVRPDGAVRDVRAWGEYVDDTQRGDAVLRGVFQDITEREAERREHRELAEEYEALLETSGDAIFLLDVDTAGEDPSFEFARLSPGYESQTGITTEEVRGKTPRDVFGDQEGAELEANYTRCVDQGAPISYREELDIGDGAQFWETSLAPVVVDGETVRIVGIARNVTEQVERERELEATNQRLESLIEATPLTVMEIDTDGTVIRWNDEAETMFGWSQDEVLGEFNPMVPDEQQEEFASHRQRVLSGERIRAKEIRRETKDGDELDLLLSVAPVTSPDGETTSILAVLEDITEQKRLEARLRSLQDTAQSLSGAESSEEIGAIAVDAAAEILDLDITGIWEYDDRENVLAPITETSEARDLFGESPRFTPGDSLAWDVFESGETQVYDDIQAEGQPHNPNTEIRSEILVPLGEYGLMSTGSVSTQVFSETDVDLFRILGATVEAALARASREEELHRQNERLDQFASVVAHDLRNPLSVAMGFLEIAEETGKAEHFEKVESAHDRIERLIEDLLTLARGETTIEDAEEIDLESITTEAWGYVDTEEATLTVADGIPTVTGDAGRLTQLFENLFRNAIEHGGADVTVTVGGLDGDDGFYVEDTGSGIPQEKQDDVFKHGVTSSEGGTGFGLSIVADIAKAHGWTVSVTDGSNGGARFEFKRSK
ncbi:PAS domain-containing protein [Halapricum salinum]|uniref:histidine kinase n=1 Tax=Halapricum salinum TaxID=1457250 RepID=A0A4D6HDU1_9EURY|nr:PAS domain-containing protein [Halapricum salinum]QCC51970.1 PAS domain S-box protein [Halapricum salinum]